MTGRYCRRKAEGIPQAWIDAAQRSPVYKMAVDWQVALPLHPEYRTFRWCGTYRHCRPSKTRRKRVMLV